MGKLILSCVCLRSHDSIYRRREGKTERNDESKIEKSKFCSRINFQLFFEIIFLVSWTFNVCSFRDLCAMNTTASTLGHCVVHHLFQSMHCQLEKIEKKIASSSSSHRRCRLWSTIFVFTQTQMVVRHPSIEQQTKINRDRARTILSNEINSRRHRRRCFVGWFLISKGEKIEQKKKTIFVVDHFNFGSRSIVYCSLVRHCT